MKIIMKIKSNLLIKKWLISLGCLIFVFSYPVLLNLLLPATHRLSSFLYFYGYGIFVFFFSSWVLIDLGCIDWSLSSERKWFKALSFGLVFVCFIHGVWTWLSIIFPYKGL